MSTGSIISHEAALQVIRQAVISLINWAFDNSSDYNPQPLQLIFDHVHLTHGQPNQANYRPVWALQFENNEKTPRIPYPQSRKEAEGNFGTLKKGIRKAVEYLGWQDLSNYQNLSQLTLFLEKFGSHISDKELDVSLFDQVKSEAAIAAALAQNPPDNKLALIGGDLMGVQKFIYTISSEGALKSLRARSFYLELATEEIVQQLLTGSMSVMQAELERQQIIEISAAVGQDLRHVLLFPLCS